MRWLFPKDTNLVSEGHFVLSEGHFHQILFRRTQNNIGRTQLCPSHVFCDNVYLSWIISLFGLKSAILTPTDTWPLWEGHSEGHILGVGRTHFPFLAGHINITRDTHFWSDFKILMCPKDTQILSEGHKINLKGKYLNQRITYR